MQKVQDNLLIDQDLATSLAGGFLASVTGIIVNELIQNPPDLESELTKTSKRMMRLAMKMKTSGLFESVVPPPASSDIPSQSPEEVFSNVIPTNSIGDSSSKTLVKFS